MKLGGSLQFFIIFCASNQFIKQHYSPSKSNNSCQLTHSNYNYSLLASYLSTTKNTFFQILSDISFNIKFPQHMYKQTRKAPKISIKQNPQKIALHLQSSLDFVPTSKMKPNPVQVAFDLLGQFMVNKFKLDGQKQADKNHILKNVEILDFKKDAEEEYCGVVEICGEHAFPVIVEKNVVLLGAARFGKGRVAAFASQNLLRERMEVDKNWTFLLRNTLNWLSPNPKKLLAIGFNSLHSICHHLSLADLNTSITYITYFSQANLEEYDCILIGNISFKYVSVQDCKNIVQYVRNGGGLLWQMRAWCWIHYGEGKTLKNWKEEALWNRVMGEMGIKLDDGSVEVRKISFDGAEGMDIKEDTLLQYSRNMNPPHPQFKDVVDQEAIDKFFEDREQILADISSLNYEGGAFSSFNYPSDSFFPIVKVNSNAIIVGGHYGAGKLFLFGHSSLYGNGEGENIPFLRSVLKWLCGQREGEKYRVGLFYDGEWDNLHAIDSTPVEMNKIQSEEDIEGNDVICITYYSDWPENLSDEAISKLRQYVQNGGNIIFASHGWVWQNYGAGKDKSLDFNEQFVGQRVLLQFGLSINKDANQIPYPYPIVHSDLEKDETNQRVRTFLYDHLLPALNGDTDNIDVSDSQFEQCLKQIENARRFQNICDIQFYHQLIDLLIKSPYNIQTNYSTLQFSLPTHTKIYKTLNALSYKCPPTQCRALPPSLNKYPGCAKNKAQITTIQVYKNKHQKCYTGLYINPGQPIKISNKNQMKYLYDVFIEVNSNLSLYGCDNGELKRYPDIARRYRVRDGEFVIASPHGGTLCFHVQNKSDYDQPLIFQIQGAYYAPYFNQSTHSYQSFQHQQTYQAPFFTIQTKNLILQGPTKNFFNNIKIDIKKLCKYWNRVIEIYKDFRGIQRNPFVKDSVFNDINIMLGYMHSGTPVMTMEDVTFQFLGFGKDIYQFGNWGIYHQFGHNHQDYKWTTEGTGQVTNNIYSLYLFWKMHGIPAMKNQWLTGDIKSLMDKYNKHFSLPIEQRLKNYNQDAQLGLYMYAILIDEYNFQIFSTLHKNYDKLQFNPNNDQQRYQMLVVQLSLVVGENLWKYFKNWGMPVTKDSEKKIQHLKRYQCKRHPQLTK